MFVSRTIKKSISCTCVDLKIKHGIVVKQIASTHFTLSECSDGSKIEVAHQLLEKLHIFAGLFHFEMSIREKRTEVANRSFSLYALRFRLIGATIMNN